MNRSEELIQNKELVQAVRELVLDGFTADELQYVAIVVTEKLYDVRVK